MDNKENLNVNEEEDAELISQILDDMQDSNEAEEKNVVQQQPEMQQQQIMEQQNEFDENNQDMYNDIEYEEDYEEPFYQEQVEQVNLSFTDRLLNEIKMPLVVLVLFLLSSFLKLDTLIYKRLPAKLVSFKYVNYLVILIVCLVYTGVYYGASKLL
jgi:magnesium-transporting ATPase (P-type)